VVPDFANPTGETLSQVARNRLLDLASELDVPVLEDSAYSALRFEGDDVPSLQALDVGRCGSIDRSRVIYLGTFSKTVAPGLRIGWICASPAIIGRLVLIKQASDLNVPVINQMVMHKLVKKGGHADFIVQAHAHYRPKRDAMLQSLSNEVPSDVTWTKPGGLFVWVTLPEAVSGYSLLSRAVEETMEAFVPGEAFVHDGTRLASFDRSRQRQLPLRTISFFSTLASIAQSDENFMTTMPHAPVI
jgi:DNA-binding transcriptional MocR family regulator